MLQLRHTLAPVALIALAGLDAPATRADTITDWSEKTAQIASAEAMTPRAVMTAALAQVAVYEAVNGITRKYPGARLDLGAARDASVDAAVAAASRVVLTKFAPASQSARIEEEYRTALAAVADGEAKQRGIAVGELAAQKVMESRAQDNWNAKESYRPRTTPGKYIPTAAPVMSHWPQRTGWVIERADQFRPGPPAALDSARWARDYEEIRSLGARDNSGRTAEQTEIARVWQTTAPIIYFQVVKSVSSQAGRDPTRNARLYSTVTQAMDDALMTIFDAKYTYEFWRPVTAIRNGDLDGNDATQRDASWVPFIETPMHPEYPCAHCVLAGAVGAVLKADLGKDPVPVLSTTSPTAPGVVRKWNSVDAFVQEVSNGRIYDGVHYRYSTEVGSDMGRKVGELAVSRNMR